MNTRIINFGISTPDLHFESIFSQSSHWKPLYIYRTAKRSSTFEQTGNFPLTLTPIMRKMITFLLKNERARETEMRKRFYFFSIIFPLSVSSAKRDVTLIIPDFWKVPETSLQNDKFRCKYVFFFFVIIFFRNVINVFLKSALNYKLN